MLSTTSQRCSNKDECSWNYVMFNSTLSMHNRSRRSWLFSNLLLTIYHNLHISLIGVDLSKKLKDPLSKFVYMLIKSDDPIKDFRYYIQISSSDLNPDFLYEFLRRCAIIEDFVIKRNSVREKFID